MTWLAVVLAVFLFYKYVERRHKIIVLKAIAALFGVGILITTGLWAYDFFSKVDFKQGLRIQHISAHKLITEDLRQKILLEMFHKRLKNDQRMKEMTADEKLIVKWVLYPYMEGSREVNKRVFRQIYGVEPRSLDSTVDWSDLEFWANKERTEYIPRFVSDLANFRNRPTAWNDKRKRLAELILAARYAWLQKETKPLFEKHLTKEDFELISEIEEEKSAIEESFYDELNKYPGKVELRISFCNDRKKTLQSSKFYVSGLKLGRSTKNALVASDFAPNGTPATLFTSDFLVKPNQCTSVTWTLSQSLFIKYEAVDYSGRWE